jgi:hypothetical protein
MPQSFACLKKEKRKGRKKKSLLTLLLTRINYQLVCGRQYSKKERLNLKEPLRKELGRM